MTQAESGKMLNESKHHPLTRIKKDLEKNRDTQDAFLEIDSNLSFFIIRGEAENKLFFDEVFNLLGQSLPLEPNTFTSDKHQLYWLGPNEWLLVADAEKKNTFEKSIVKKWNAHHQSIRSANPNETQWQ